LMILFSWFPFDVPMHLLSLIQWSQIGPRRWDWLGRRIFRPRRKIVWWLHSVLTW
jgi:hypothetical protein